MRHLATLLLLLSAVSPAAGQSAPTSARPYSIYVSSEAADIVTRIDVDGAGWRKARAISVKLVPNEISGPHNVAVAPDGRFWYVSIAHGRPNGAIWKYDAATDSLIARTAVGMFPTTVALSPNGEWAWIPNSDFHGDRGKANTISALYVPTMEEIAQVPACDMPHGSKWNSAGTTVYIACMMSDELLTIDPGSFAVTKRVQLGSGKPMSMTHHDKPGAASSTMRGQDPDCLATYVSISPDDRYAYVACNHSNELQVRDAKSLELISRVPTGTGAYNVEPSPDGKYVVVSNKKAQSVSIIGVGTWKELARVPTSKKLPHGIAFSPDNRFLFVTSESIGTDPGAIDVIDLSTRKPVGSLELPLQPTGIAIRR